MVINSAYCNLRNEVISRCGACGDEDLKKLKDEFKDRINSTRRVENIGSICELVRMLEKRNLLNAEDVSCLRTIVRMLHRDDLIQLINNGLEQHIIHLQPSVSMPQQHQQEPVLNLHRAASPRDRIHNLIINQIGRKWKDLARNLKISEGKIDELDDRYRFDPSERVREILRFHELNTPTAHVWYLLMDALCRSRRTDLRNEVQRILAGN